MRAAPEVVAIRAAVASCLGDLPAGELVLVACSGGADSLSLAAATAWVAPRRGLRAGLITVDHGLQEGSEQRAREVAAWGVSVGLSPSEAVSVRVEGAGGPEAAARDIRYKAINRATETHGAAAVLLGHTRDDQAETVLLALARGSGPRGMSGMPPVRGKLRRPLLDIARAQTRAACKDLGLIAWEDPHNTDPAYARSRVRGSALPALVEALGPGVVGSLARSAGQLAADNEVLDELAERGLAEARTAKGLSVEILTGLPRAVRSRVLHLWSKDLGTPGSALSHRHVAALDALVTAWHGQGPVALPGGRRVARRHGELVLVDAE